MNIERFDINFKVSDSELNKMFWENYYSQWEEGTYDFLFKHFDKEKTFLDIGAWVGPISIVASFHSKNIIAFEPDHIAYAEFLENIKLNNIDNIKVLMNAVSTKDVITLGCPVLGQSGTSEAFTENSFEAKCITVKQIFDRYNLSEDNVSVIKIDIEGHEETLLQDEFLIGLNIPMHISIHPFLAKDRDAFFSAISPFFERRGIDINEYTNKRIAELEVT